MYKIFSFLALFLIVACGTSEELQKESKQEVTITQQETSASIENDKVQEEQQLEPEEEVIEIPTQRTVDTGPNFPWQHFTSEKVEELQTDGESVYLFSDAEKLEQHVIEMVNTEVPDYAPTTKEKAMESTASHLQQFIKGVSPYVDNEAYFNKLEEVQNALLNGEYDKVPTLIEEAKSLRESE